MSSICLNFDESLSFVGILPLSADIWSLLKCKIAVYLGECRIGTKQRITGRAPMFWTKTARAAEWLMAWRLPNPENMPIQPSKMCAVVQSAAFYHLFLLRCRHIHCSKVANPELELRGHAALHQRHVSKSDCDINSSHTSMLQSIGVFIFAKASAVSYRSA